MTMINLLHIFALFVTFEIKFCFVYSQEFLKVVRSLQAAITLPNVMVMSLMSLVPRLDVTLRMSQDVTIARPRMQLFTCH